MPCHAVARDPRSGICCGTRCIRWIAFGQRAQSDEPLASKIEKAFDADASKPRRSGRVGDFNVIPVSGRAVPEANIFACADGGGTDAVEPGPSLRAQELWSPAFEDGGIGWSCRGEGLVGINNEGGGGHGAHGDGSLLVRGYIRSLPVPVAREAPEDRLELMTVEGHPALLERPVPEYPYGKSSLVVIERFPQGETPGIVVFVEIAPSPEAAIKHAEEIMP